MFPCVSKTANAVFTPWKTQLGDAANAISGGLQPTGGHTAAELWIPAKLLSVLWPLALVVVSLVGALFLACALTLAYDAELRRLWKGVSRVPAAWRRAADELGVADGLIVCTLAVMLARSAVAVTRDVAACATPGCVTKSEPEMATTSVTTEASTTPAIARFFNLKLVLKLILNRCRIGSMSSYVTNLVTILCHGYSHATTVCRRW